MSSTTKPKKKHDQKKKNPVVKENQSCKSVPFTVDKNNGDSGHGDSDAASTTPYSDVTPVETMTSRDFQFDNNAHIEMIDQMLKDKIRIKNFQAAIMHNKHLFKGKSVLDIGCGIGILSLFAAKAGAAKVYAVDSSNVIYYTRKIVAANGYDDIIEVFKGEIEEVDLPAKEVDIIVSDWMGYTLLFQSKCRSVIYARDKWLKKPDGLIFPDQGKLFMVALEDGKRKNKYIEWWGNVYGFNMKCLREVAQKEPRYQLIKPQNVLSNQFPIKSLDLYTATNEDIGFRSKYMLSMQRSGRMDGISLYFHVYFTKSHTPLGFSTDPWSAGTNWMQTIFFFDQSLSVNDGSLYYGGIEFCPAQKPIDLNDIQVNLELLKGDPSQVDIEMEMSWRLKPAWMATTLEPGCDDNEANCLKSLKKTSVNDDIIPSINKLNINNNREILSTTVVLSDKQTFESRGAPITIPPPTVDSVTSLNCYNNDNNRDYQYITIGKQTHHINYRKDRRSKKKHNKKGKIL